MESNRFNQSIVDHKCLGLIELNETISCDRLQLFENEIVGIDGIDSDRQRIDFLSNEFNRVNRFRFWYDFDGGDGDCR